MYIDWGPGPTLMNEGGGGGGTGGGEGLLRGAGGGVGTRGGDGLDGRECREVGVVLAACAADVGGVALALMLLPALVSVLVVVPAAAGEFVLLPAHDASTALTSRTLTSNAAP